MPIIVFLVDTSASMCQRAMVTGVPKTYLDIAKGAVETIIKLRQRTPDGQRDRYMLLTFEESSNNVKAGWKENLETFMKELKNLQSNGCSSMAKPLKDVFDLLNMNRILSGIDTYGKGRCPFFLEPAVIIVLTDGGMCTYQEGDDEAIITPTKTPYMSLTKEPFRWDQRVFSLVLRMPGHLVEERKDINLSRDTSKIEKMCEVTGGRSYKVRSHYDLTHSIKNIVQHMKPGVVLQFDQFTVNNDTSNTSGKHMIYLANEYPSQKPPVYGNWPIPESYWPNPSLIILPPRDAHPKIKIVSQCCHEPELLPNFPIDRYEVEMSPYTLSMKPTKKVWPVMVSTGREDKMPFGYLKLNSTHSVVHLYVLPYNYPMLMPLMNDLFNKYYLNPPNEWKEKFNNYLKTIPQYYFPFLWRALTFSADVPYRFVQYLLPLNNDHYLSPVVISYLEQMKNTAIQNQQNLCKRVQNQLNQSNLRNHHLELVELSMPRGMGRDFVSHPMLRNMFGKMQHERQMFNNHMLVVPDTRIRRKRQTNYVCNPYNIARRDLLYEIVRMRQALFDQRSTKIRVYRRDDENCRPIADMGNYQEYLKNRVQPLRELQSTEMQRHLFGNPFKSTKHMMMMDEADLNDRAPLESFVSGGSRELTGTRKRNIMPKANPLRKGFPFRGSSLDLGETSNSANCKPEKDSSNQGYHFNNAEEDDE
uniref:VWFA domain-containing protein n=1 Tax=Anopheles farauti TaxID=69004 RepID=A0A182Q1Q1_9DIPT